MSIPIRPRSTVGRPPLSLLPGRAAVDALVQARLGTAVDQRPLVAPALVGAGVDDVGIARDRGARSLTPVSLADLEHPLPALAAVDGLVEAAVAAGGPQRALGGDPDDVGVPRIDDDACRCARNPPVRPVLPAGAAVDRLVDAVAVGDAALAVVLAGADPDRQRVVGIDGHAADRIRALTVEDRREGGAGVGRLPDAARGDGDVPDPRVGRIDGEIPDAAGHQRRPDPAQREAGEVRLGPGRLRLLGLVLLLGGDRRSQDQRQRHAQRHRNEEPPHDTPPGVFELQEAHSTRCGTIGR